MTGTHGIGGTPPGTALDQFLRDSYTVVQEVHRNLDSIRAVADHLTPVEDLVEFQNEISQLYANLGVLVAASDLLVSASPAGVALLQAVDAAAQRVLLGLGTAAQEDASYFATSADFQALRTEVTALSADVAAILVALAGKVDQADFDAAMTPLLARVAALEAEVANGVGTVNDRIDTLIQQLTGGVYNEGLAQSLDDLTVRVGQTEAGLAAEAAKVFALQTELATNSGLIAGNSSAIEGLSSQVTLIGNEIDAVSQDLVALNSTVTNLGVGQTANTNSIQSLTSRTTTNEQEILAQGAAITQLEADVVNNGGQTQLNTSAIAGLETRVSSTEAQQSIINTQYAQLESRVVDTETGLVAQNSATDALTTRVTATEDAIEIASEERTELRASLSSTGNLAPNAGFVHNLRNWTLFSRGDGWLDAALTRNLAPDAPGALPAGTWSLSITQDDVPSGDAGIRSSDIFVEDGGRYFLSAYLAAQNCTARLEYRIFDAAGAQIGFGVVAEVTSGPKAKISEWERPFGDVAIPADGVRLQIQLWITDCNTGFPKAWLLRPQFEPKLPEQVSPSPWMDSVNGIEETLSTAVESLETRVTANEDGIDTLAQQLTDLGSQIGVVTEWRIVHHSGSGAHTTVGSPLPAGLYPAGSETATHLFQRGLTMLRFNMDGTLASAQRFDTFSNPSERDALELAIASLTPGDPFVIVSQDNHGVKDASLTWSMEESGALAFAGVPGTKPYILAGCRQAGKGGGLEVFPAGSLLWQDFYLSVVNDTPKGVGERSGVVQEIAGQATALDSLTTRVTDTENGLTALSSSVTALDARVDTTETQISSQGTALSDLTVRVTATENEVINIASDVTALEIGLSDAESDIAANASATSALTSRVTATEAGITGLTSQTTALSNRLDSAEVGIASNTSAVSDLTTRVTNAEGVNTAQAASLTALSSQLQGSGGDNLLPNSSFEDVALTDPTRARHWARSGSVTSVGSFVDSPLPASTQAWRLDHAAVPVNGYIGAVVNAADGIVFPKIEAEKPYTLSAMLRATPGTELRVYVEWLNSADLLLSGIAESAAVTASGAFQKVTVTGTPPATAVKARVYPARVFNRSGAPLAIFVEIDNAQFQEGTTATAYAPSTLLGDQVNADAIMTLETRVTEAEGDITAVSSAQTALASRVGDVEAAVVNEIITSANKDAAHTASINSLSTRMTNAEGTLTAQAGALSSLDTRVTTAEDSISSQSSALTSLQAQVDALDVDSGGSGAAIAALDTRVTAAEGSIVSQGNAITQLQNSVVNANRVFVQPDPPATAGRIQGDLWIDTNDNNKIYSFDQATSTWIVRQDSGKNTVFVQPSAPTARALNDLWFDSDDGFKCYRWDGSSWVDITDFRTTANATAITNLTTRVGNVEGVNTSQAAAITALESSVNNPLTGLNAQASALTQLTTRVTDTENANAAQSAAITTLTSQIDGKASVTAVQALETSVGGSGNILPNSTFSVDLTGWSMFLDQAATGVQPVKDLAGVDWRPTGISTLGVTVAGTPTAAQQYHVAASTIPAIAGKRYCFSAYLAGHRCGYGLMMQYLNEAGTVLGTSPSQIVENSGSLGGKDLSAWDRRALYGVAPANTRTIRVIFVVYWNGQNNPYAWLCRPMLEEVPTTQQVPSPWSAGGAESFAAWNVRLDVNGYISGLSSVNNGTSSDFTVLADKFMIAAPGQSKRQLFSVDITGTRLATDLIINPGRIVVDTGTHMKVMGVGFGLNNDLIEWFGPKMPINQCSRANAVVWVGTDGAAYFGGTLSSGTIYTSRRTSDTTIGAEVIIGPYGTNGNVKTIVAQYTSNWALQESGRVADQYQGDPCSTTVVLYRRIGTGGEQLVGNYTFNGTTTAVEEFISEPGGSYWVTNISQNTSGSVTITDNLPSTDNRTYRLIIMSRTGYYGAVQTQEMILSSTEE